MFNTYSEEIVNKIITLLKEKFPDKIQMFDSPSIAGDAYEIIFEEDGVEVRWSKEWEYVDILGLSDADFNKVFAACGYYLSRVDDFKF